MSKKQAIQVTRIPLGASFIDVLENGPSLEIWGADQIVLIALDLEEAQLLADAINAAVERMKTK
jgi:hypothetical protein